VTVEDTTPPEIQAAMAAPNVLWPPNHKMKPVTVSVSVEDICDTMPICKITEVSSNAPVNGLGDGNTMPDRNIIGDLTVVDLRAERAGPGHGRVYTIEVTCTDESGNSAMASVDVSVPPADTCL